MKGFTLIEILISLAIVVVIGVFATISLTGTRNRAVLTDTTKEIGTLLRQAQSDSMSQSKGAYWGVHFDNTTATAPFYSLFYSFNATYISSTQVDRYGLPFSVCYTTSSVPVGSSTDIVFTPITGLPVATNTSGGNIYTASTTIVLQLMAGNGGCGSGGLQGSAGSVSRAGSGKIFFDDLNTNRTNL